MSRERPLIERVVHTAYLLSGTMDFKQLISRVTEQALDNTGADIAAMYLLTEGHCPLVYSRGRDKIPLDFSRESPLVQFLMNCKEVVISSDYRENFFSELFIHDAMKSAAALPLVSGEFFFGFLLINTRKRDFFNNEKLQFLEGVNKMASGLMHNSKTHDELKKYLEEIEALKKYQESIFSSMSNLLVTVDKEGTIRYFNKMAHEKMGFNDSQIGLPFHEFLKEKMEKKTITRLKTAHSKKNTLLGVEGIFNGENGEIDYSLNFSPLEDSKGENNGHVMIFSDQTAEREMAKEVTKVKEDRRLIKDVFSRYLSADIIKTLSMSPDSVHLGGDKKRATIFFADICGYTAFSEGKEPEYILGVLNEFFNEAVDIILQKRGYIDKFIGDCIMAAWGVPMVSEEQDAFNAVDCALSLQELVKSPTRNFFKGEAESLMIAIGMHTGSLVAGNIGGNQRMDYSVIGDTVNIAARLEGVSTSGEIIITQQTRDLIGDRFIVDKRKPVMVKGKAKPLQIYNVVGRK